MPTFLLFKDGKKVEEVRGADVRGLKSVVERVGGELKSVSARAEADKKASQQAEATRTEGAKEVEEKTVSGSYGMTKNSGWKMSLH